MNDLLTQSELQVVNSATGILESKFKREHMISAHPEAVKRYCRLKLGGLDKEVFAVLFLDSHFRLIQYSELFHGTIDRSAVYPREVVKAALACGAANVIFSHNHPSGRVQPSKEDLLITDKLKNALALVDVHVADHIIVSSVGEFSFSEEQLI